MAKEKYDFIIIGGGGTGLAAGMYAARLGLKTLILGYTHGSEFPIGGVITTTNIVENYPGFKKISGEDLAKKLEEHARDYELVTIKQELVESVRKSGKIFLLKTKKEEYESRTILFATGTKWKKLEVPGALDFENAGVNYCALCDGPLFKNKTVAIVGGSDSAAKDALVLGEHAKKVYVISRSTLHPEPINMERIKANKKIEVIEGNEVKEVEGDKVVTGVILDKHYKGQKELAVDGLFVAIGHIVLSELAEKLGVKVDKKKEIIINHKTSETNVPGVFAAGDVTDKPFKQLITGVADGCTAAYSAYEYISKEKIK
ncbi:MAG: FAD-dependent oxidoreductase [Nanoarchaeota archaeon]|nr:FAD-dependent oxidoreductase [Nanoarchaeota archaeon]